MLLLRLAEIGVVLYAVRPRPDYARLWTHVPVWYQLFFLLTLAPLVVFGAALPLLCRRPLPARLSRAGADDTRANAYAVTGHDTYRQLTERGVDISVPEKQPWGTFARFRDPDGNTFILSSR